MESRFFRNTIYQGDNVYVGIGPAKESDFIVPKETIVIIEGLSYVIDEIKFYEGNKVEYLMHRESEQIETVSNASILENTIVFFCTIAMLIKKTLFR